MSQLFQLRKRFLPVLILLAGLLPSAWLLYELSDTPQLGLSGDDVMYIGAAQSLAHDGTYREYALPGEPWQTKYPPGYPLLLAAIVKFNPPHLNFWIIAHSWIWLAIASAALAWAMLQAGLTPVQAAMVGALWAANPSGAEVGILAMADAPYCALLFFVLGLIPRLDKAAVWKVAIAGLLMGIACLIRSVGIIALLGLFAWMLWRKSFKTAFWFSAFASLLPAIWMLWSHAHMPSTHGPVDEYYFSYLGRWIQTVHQAGLRPMLRLNVMSGVVALGKWLIPLQASAYFEISLCIILLGVGCAAVAKWGGGAITAVGLATLVFHLFWNWPPNGRFFLPVAPMFLAAGVATLSLRPAIFRILTLLAVMVADIRSVAEVARINVSERDTGMPFVYDFIKKQLPADAVVIGDERVWLFAGRMPIPMEYVYREYHNSQMEFFMGYKEVARQFGAEYVLAGPGARWDISFERAKQLTSAMHADSSLEPLFSRNGVELFRIRGSTEAGLVK